MPWLRTAVGAPPAACKPLGEDIRPALVGVGARAIAVGDRIPECDDSVRALRRVDHDVGQKEPRQRGGIRLDIRVCGLVPGHDVGGLPAIEVHRCGRRHVGEKETDRDAAERCDSEIHRIADGRCSRRDRDRRAAAEGEFSVRPGLDPRLAVRDGDVRFADDKRLRPVLVGKHDPHLAAADRNAGNLPDGLVPEVPGKADWREEVRFPDGLRACGPGADPTPAFGCIGGWRSERQDCCGKDRRRMPQATTTRAE